MNNLTAMIFSARLNDLLARKGKERSTDDVITVVKQVCEYFGFASLKLQITPEEVYIYIVDEDAMKDGGDRTGVQVTISNSVVVTFERQFDAKEIAFMWRAIKEMRKCKASGKQRK